MKKHIHLIGIGGYGMSAIAQVLHEMGYLVSGSDRQLSDLAINLQNQGITVYQGHTAAQISGADLVVRSSAIPLDNPEVKAALEQNIPVQKRDQFLGDLLRSYQGIGVAGTHGKTTTTAMIAWMLSALNQDPSYIIGGVSKNLGNNAHAGKGPHFVIEADEYDRMFLGLHLSTAVITNLEHDHPDCYPTFADYLDVFAQFVKNIPADGLVLVNADDSGLIQLRQTLQQLEWITYGFDPTADYQAKALSNSTLGGYRFDFYKDNGKTCLTEVNLSVPGKHNVSNACAALALADRFGLDLHQAASALSEFASTGRRFDILGTVNEITIIDDYAHHPTDRQKPLPQPAHPGGVAAAYILPHANLVYPILQCL